MNYPDPGPDHYLIPLQTPILEDDEIWDFGEKWRPCTSIVGQLAVSYIRRRKLDVAPSAVKVLLPRLLWLDIETTGLDPDNDEMLEIAMVATDETGTFECSHTMLLDADVVDERSARQVTDLLFDQLPVLKMHRDSGLLSERIDQETWTYEAAETHLIETFLPYLGRHMAGSNPSFDRSFLKVHMPRLERLWHHRHFDMNTLYAFHEVEKAPCKHRAMSDLSRDIENLRTIRRNHA